MNYIDLFSGIGGFALGAYWAGMKFENHFNSDIEDYANKVYKLRFPESIQLGDITKIDFNKLKEEYGNNWVLTGGFPCQDISVAGKGRGLIDEQGNKTRSGLWFEMWRAISILRPQFAIMENVGAITFRGLAQVLQSLHEIGYNAEWQDIRAEDMGAPHKRERIWIVAYSNKKRLQTILEKPKNIKQIFKQTSNMFYTYSNDTPFKRLGNYKGIRKNNGVSHRVDRLKGLGNAIVPQIACVLFRLIKDYID